MEDIFEEKICSVCKNYNSKFCSKKIQKRMENRTTITFCMEYEKDVNKIIPYQKPIVVTANRNYISKIEY